MNWEAASAIGEMAGAIAVIISLLYLASQIRQGRSGLDQNNEIAKANAQTDMHFRFQDLVTKLADKPGLRDIVAKGLEDYHSLSLEEKNQFYFYISPLVVVFDNVLRLYRQGLIDEDFLAEFRLVTLAFLVTPGGREWWESTKAFYIEGVRVYLEKELEASENMPDPITVLAPWGQGSDTLQAQ